MSVKLLAFAASHRANSFNRRLLEMAAHEAEHAGAAITRMEYADFDAPLFKDLDEDTHHLPEGASRLGDAILAHDGFLLASPEYNWSMPGSLKNLIDWLSVDPRKPLTGKLALLLCASPSTRGGVLGLTQLRVPLENQHVWVYPQLIGIGGCTEAIAEAHFTHEKDHAFLRSHVAEFVATARRFVRA